MRLPILTNDTSESGALRITDVFRMSGPWGSHACGSVAINHDDVSVTYSPLGNNYGTDIFNYTIVNTNGGRSTSTVEISIRAKPLIQIAQPEDGDHFGVSSSLTVSATASDYDGVVTNVALWMNVNSDSEQRQQHWFDLEHQRGWAVHSGRPSQKITTAFPLHPRP